MINESWNGFYLDGILIDGTVKGDDEFWVNKLITYKNSEGSGTFEIENFKFDGSFVNNGFEDLCHGPGVYTS